MSKAVKLPLEQIKALLRSNAKNVDILDNNQSATSHVLTVIGKKTDLGEGKFKEEFIQKTKPSKELQDAGLPPTRYIRVMITPYGGKLKVEDGREVYRGTGKPNPYNIFEASRPDLFNFFAAQLRELTEDKKPKY